MDVPQFIAGRFRIECEIGTGGMGTVYRATHLGLERPVAVKIIRSEFATDPDVTERFLREARTMARLRHQHAAMIFDAGSLPDGRHFIIMEYVEGVTLSAALAREGQFSPERAVKIAVEICDVLEEAHRLGIVHRDLKPSNIMLSEHGVRVLDFGVAKVLASPAESTATHASTGSGKIVGTPRYMSPEQCLGHRVGARSDLYSLGVLLYEMIAGRPPFMDVLPSAVMVKQATAPPPPLPKLRPDVSRALAIAVHTLLAKRPEDRPRTAADARLMLSRSLTFPERTLPDHEPLSSTVAALTSGRDLVFRIGAPLALVLLFSAGLFAWDYTTESATTLQTQGSTLASMSGGAALTMPSSKQPLATPAGKAIAPQPTAKTAPARTELTIDVARTKVAQVSNGRGSGVQIVDTDSGPAIVAIHNAKKSGSSHFFMMEKRVGKYQISSRGPLDAEGFRHAAWTTEVLDADEDGYPEVLFVGSNSPDRKFARRLVLFAPHEHKTYSMFLTGEMTAKGTPKIIWSTSAEKPEASAYRAALRLKARNLLAQARKR
jgi:serine/threonine protein kinase